MYRIMALGRKHPDSVASPKFANITMIDISIAQVLIIMRTNSFSLYSYIYYFFCLRYAMIIRRECNSSEALD